MTSEDAASDKNDPVPESVSTRQTKVRGRSHLPWWKKLIFALVVVIGPLLAMEVCLRLFAPQTTWTENPVNTPWTEWGLVPSQALRTYGPEFGEIICYTNSDAIRDHVERPVEKPKGMTRILVLGDSFVEGWGCWYEQGFAYRLSCSLQTQFGEDRIDVIKAGVRGFGTDDAVNAFECKWAAYQPDVVVIGVLLNDVLETPAAQRVSSQPGEAPTASKQGAQRVADRRLVSDFGPMNEATQRVHLLAAIRRMLMANDSLHLRLFFLNRPERCVLESPLSPEAERMHANTLSQLAVLAEGCEAIGAELHVLLIAQGVQVRLLAAPVEGLDPRVFSRRLGEGLDQLGVSYLDTLDALAELPVTETFFTCDGHLTAKGHEIVARELVDYLLDHSSAVSQLRKE